MTGVIDSLLPFLSSSMSSSAGIWRSSDSGSSAVFFRPRTLRYKLAQMRDAGMDVEAYLFAT